MSEVPKWKMQQQAYRRQAKHKRVLAYGFKGMLPVDLGIRRFKRAHPEASYKEIRKIKDERWAKIAPGAI